MPDENERPSVQRGSPMPDRVKEIAAKHFPDYYHSECRHRCEAALRELLREVADETLKECPMTQQEEAFGLRIKARVLALAEGSET